jgi:hypothetical protein
VVVAPKDTHDEGLLMVKVADSSPSIDESSIMAKVAVPVVDPLAMVMVAGKVVPLKSVLVNPVPVNDTLTVCVPITDVLAVAVRVMEVRDVSDPVVVLILRLAVGKSLSVMDKDCVVVIPVVIPTDVLLMANVAFSVHS